MLSWTCWEYKDRFVCLFFSDTLLTSFILIDLYTSFVEIHLTSLTFEILNVHNLIKILNHFFKIMSHSRNLGTESFVDAQSIVQNCWVAGLLQNSTDVVRLSEDKVLQYFKDILFFVSLF